MKKTIDPVEAKRQATIKEHNLDKDGCIKSGDDKGMQVVCNHCGVFAGFNESPEGQNCSVCGDWICDDCTDYKKMSELAEETGHECCDPLCKQCAKDKDSVKEYLGNEDLEDEE